MHNPLYLNLSDEDLIALIQLENRILDEEEVLEIISILFLRYKHLLFGVCLKYLDNYQDAEDAVMDIYLQMPKIILVPKISNFRGWIYVLCKNFCLMQLRNKRKMTVSELPDERLISEDFSYLNSIFERENMFHLLENCIERLTSEQQKIIQLFYFDKRCYNEISESTGFSWDKVRSLIQNARKNLNKCMRKYV